MSETITIDSTEYPVYKPVTEEDIQEWINELKRNPQYILP